MAIPGKNEAFDLRNRKSTTAATITTTNGVPTGGSAGQILTKATAADYDTTWATSTSIQKGDGTYVLIRNNTGSIITKGQVVYSNGANGNRVTVALAQANAESTSSRTYGVASEDIAINADGYVQIEGYLVGIDTASLGQGSQLYLSGTTAGAYTTTKPYAPTHLVYVGTVVKAASANGGGSILVKCQNGYELDELHNVDNNHTNTLADNDVLSYTSSTGLWYNKTLTQAGIASATHVHGNITNAGALTTTVTAGSAPKFAIADSTTNVLGTWVPTGTASSTTYLRGDGSWSTPPAGTTYTLASGTNNGTLKLTASTGGVQDNIAVTGLGSAAYTASTAYIPVSVATATGDILYAPAPNAITRLAGSTTNGWVLTYDTTLARPTWAAPSGGGSGFTGAGTSVTGITTAATVALPISTTGGASVGALSLTGGNSTATNGVGGAITITAGNATAATTSTGGSVTIKGGTGNSTSGAGGIVSIDGGLGSAANGNGSVAIGTATTTDSITLGRSGFASVSIPGQLQSSLLLKTTSTSASSPLIFAAQTGAPVLAAGSVDYDGNVFYGTPKVNNTTAGKGLIPTQQYFIQNATTSIATTSTGNATITANAMVGKAIYLAASTTYEVEAVLYVQGAYTVTAATNFGINLLYPTGSTALINAFYSYGTATSAVATNQTVLNSTTAFTISSSITSGNYIRIELKGIVKTAGTAGNFSPVFTLTNAATPATATMSIATNSYIKVNPVGGVGADINIGGWA